jgi:hypothetical protein
MVARARAICVSRGDVSRSAAATLGLGLLIGAPVAFVLATVLTTVWFERVYVPSIAGED